MKTALITGASRGIGEAVARTLAGEGIRVAIGYRTQRKKAQELAEELGGLAVYCDVTDPRSVQLAVDNVLEKFCQLDILVCNAGMAKVGLFQEMTPEEWRQVFAVNVDGVFHCCRAVLPHFIRQKSGKIVTISSMWGQVGASCEVCYSASKAAVIGLTKALAKETAPSGITVNCVAPGVIATDMNKSLTAEDLQSLAEETPLGRIGTPEDVAHAVSYLVSDGANFVTGQVLAPNGGLVI